MSGPDDAGRLTVRYLAAKLGMTLTTLGLPSAEWVNDLAGHLARAEGNEDERRVLGKAVAATFRHVAVRNQSGNEPTAEQIQAIVHVCVVVEASDAWDAPPSTG